MLSFKEKSAIKIYKVDLKKPKEAHEIIEEILKTERRKKTTRRSDIFTNYGKYFSRYADLTDEGGMKIVEKYPDHDPSYSEYTLGTVTTETITYKAPYTLALGAENFTFGQPEYSSLLKEYEISNELVRVVNGANIDELHQLLARFDNNPEALEIFLRKHYPDLLYLRRYLECIRLEQTDEFIPKKAETPARTEAIEIATSNTEVAKKLNLNFKGRKK